MSRCPNHPIACRCPHPSQIALSAAAMDEIGEADPGLRVNLARARHCLECGLVYLEDASGLLLLGRFDGADGPGFHPLGAVRAARRRGASTFAHLAPAADAA